VRAVLTAPATPTLVGRLAEGGTRNGSRATQPSGEAAGLTGEKEVIMTVITNQPPQTALRLKLDGGPARKAALDGAWWPRTTDAEAELPPLLEALGGLRGEITHVLLGATEWDLPHPRRLAPGRAGARLGWFTSQPAGVVTIMTEFGQDRFDLLVVPPDTARDEAEAAMSAAADADDNSRASELLAGTRRTG
jgi:hypothetical protein